MSFAAYAECHLPGDFCFSKSRFSNTFWQRNSKKKSLSLASQASLNIMPQNNFSKIFKILLSLVLISKQTDGFTLHVTQNAFFSLETFKKEKVFSFYSKLMPFFLVESLKQNRASPKFFRDSTYKVWRPTILQLLI